MTIDTFNTYLRPSHPGSQLSISTPFSNKNSKISGKKLRSESYEPLRDWPIKLSNIYKPLDRVTAN